MIQRKHCRAPWEAQGNVVEELEEACRLMLRRPPLQFRQPLAQRDSIPTGLVKRGHRLEQLAKPFSALRGRRGDG